MTILRTPTYPLGKWLWVWEVSASGDIQTVITQAKESGSVGLVVKAFDGIEVWPQFAAAQDAVKAAGLRLAAWGYVYPQNVAQTAQAAKAAVTAGAEFVILDAEVEFETPAGPINAQELGGYLRDALPDTTIGYTTFALPAFHALFPFVEFSRFCDFVAPQCYWADAGMNPETMLDQSIQQLQGYGKRIFPVGQAYPPATAADIAEFGAACAKRWIEGVSFWDAQSSSPELRAAISGMEIYAPKPPAPVRYQVVTGWFSGTEEGCPAAEEAARTIQAQHGWHSWVQKV